MMNEQFDPTIERKKICNLPDDPSLTDWEVGFVDGQLLPHGATPELIIAVADSDQPKMRAELLKISDPVKRERLIKIVERIAPIIAKNR